MSITIFGYELIVLKIKKVKKVKRVYFRPTNNNSLLDFIKTL